MNTLFNNITNYILITTGGMKNISRPLILILLISILLRLGIVGYALQSRENTDILRWRDWARISYLYSLSDTYKPDYLTFGTYPNNMPPGTLYTVFSMYHVNLQASKVFLKILDAEQGSLPWLNGGLFNFLLRIPSLAADIIIGLLIFLIVRKNHSEKIALFSMSIFLFNPVTLYNSAFWGQMDSINNMFFLFAIYFLIKQRSFLSFISFFLSLYVKLSLTYFIPFFFLLLFQTFKKKGKFFLFLFLSLLLIFLITLPISSTPHSWIYNFLKTNSLGEMTNITAFAFNFWWLVFMPHIQIGKPTDAFQFSEIKLIGSPFSDQILWGIQLTLIGIFLFIILSLPIFLKIWQLKEKVFEKEKVFLFFSLIACLAFLFLPQMHERYLFPMLPLLAIYAGTHKKYLPIFVILSLLNFINLYLVWHPILSPSLPYVLMNNKIFQWTLSFGTVGVGIYFYVKVFTEHILHESKN